MSDSLTRVPNTMTTGLVHQHEKGAPHGVASLDEEAKVSEKYLPDFIHTSRLIPKRAIFFRHSAAYRDNVLVPPNQPRYYSSGILIEEGTTNLLTTNQSSVETDTSGFIANSATISRTTSEAWHGQASLQVVTDGTAPVQGVSTWLPTPATPGTTYTASVYVKAPAGIPLRLRFQAYTGTTFITDMALMPFVASGDWQRIVASGVCPEGADGMRIQVSTVEAVATTFYIDGLQLETKSYATSWILGGTTRKPEILTIPVNGLLPTKFCVRQWVYINKTSKRKMVGSSWPELFTLFKESDSLTCIRLMHDDDNDSWVLQVRDDNGVGSDILVPDSYTPDGPHLFEVACASNTIMVRIDGVTVAVEENPALPSAFSNLNVGGRFHYANTVFGQTQILNYCPSEHESLEAYNRGVNNLVWDYHTVALYNWDKTGLISGFENSQHRKIALRSMFI